MTEIGFLGEPPFNTRGAQSTAMPVPVRGARHGRKTGLNPLLRSPISLDNPRSIARTRRFPAPCKALQQDSTRFVAKILCNSTAEEPVGDCSSQGPPAAVITAGLLEQRP
jgi:hypothetical protein